LKAGNHIKDWILAQKIKGLSIELLNPEGKTPLILAVVEGNGKGNALLYGHFDKQPHMTGWNEGLSPTDPVIKDGKLYGRGAADDGYSGFAAILAIKTCQNLGLPHPRCVILLEADEESGSADLPYYLEVQKEKIGIPDIIVKKKKRNTMNIFYPIYKSLLFS
jgi:acetylornithine deacetylase/succinyl-diaminopimelate desuccinylase-like protein